MTVGNRTVRNLFVAFFMVISSVARAAFQVPELRGPVNDYAGMMSQQDQERLNAALRQLWNQGGSQIAVLTVPDLGGEVIEQASIAVVDKWKLGGKKADNGVLLIASKAEHKIRIEVGRGLEGVLPDIYAKRIVADTMVPLLKEGHASAAIVAGVKQIASYTDPKATLALGDVSQQPAPSEDEGNGRPISFGIILFFVIIVFLLRRRGGRFGGWGGGFGGGGGGGGGGGFSGGGGGFSGGGASDSW